MTVVQLPRLGITSSGVTRTGDTADGYRVMASQAGSHSHAPSFLEIALVTVVLGIAASVAIPEYLNLRSEASDDTAKSRLVQADRNLDAGAAVPAGVTVHAAGSSYCLETTARGRVWHALRHAKPVRGACPAG